MSSFKFKSKKKLTEKDRNSEEVGDDFKILENASKYLTKIFEMLGNQNMEGIHAFTTHITQIPIEFLLLLDGFRVDPN